MKARRGFSLVEVLVALVVLSIGLLGAARLFVVTLQGNASAESRLLALNLAEDIADRIRANRSAGTAYAGTPATSNTCATGAISATVVCTPAAMAANDLYLWQQSITNTLAPGSTGTITVIPGTAGAPSSYGITLNWPEQSTGQTLTYTLNVQI
jgi:type IV pilus assembly protein PilV